MSGTNETERCRNLDTIHPDEQSSEGYEAKGEEIRSNSFVHFKK